MSDTVVKKKRRWPYVLGGIFALLVIVVAVALWRLDAILLKTARDQAATYSQKLGRPIEIGDISTKLFPTIGAEVENVTIGPAEGEELPLAQLAAIDVRVAAGPLLSSSGKDIQVKNAEVSGLTVNVVRFPDGTTNVQRLLQKLEEQQPKEEEKPEEEQPPTDLSGVHVERAALTDGTIRFVDRSGGQQARELAVKDLDIEVKDLQVGKPLIVDLAAAVLADKQNLKIVLNAAPLPATLVPTPVLVALKAERIDLAPLGPFLPPDVGLQAGTVDADWQAMLGGAVPGGTGPTNVTGVIKALGLRFAGAEGGKALDVVLDTDVTADLADGSVDLEKLKLDVGPASITGQGKVNGLLTDAPVVQGFELVGRNLDPAAIAEYYPPLRKQLNGMIAGPIGLAVRGSGSGESQALNVDVDLTPVRLRVPAQLTKDAGATMKLTANVTGAAASGGALRFNADANLDGVDLRPGLLVDKAPGQRMQVSAAGTYAPSKSGSGMKVDISKLVANVLEDTVTGTASFALAGQGKKQTTSFVMDVKSQRLNADALLMKEEEVVAHTGGKPVPPPPDDPTRFNGYRGDIRFAVGSLRYTEMDMTNVTGVVKMTDDLITVEKFSTGLYGGKITADGTTVRLGPLPEKRPFEAKVKVEGIEVEQALAKATPQKVLTGRFNGNVDVKGVGYTPDQLQQTLLGAINGNILGGALLSTDLVASVSEPLAKALSIPAKGLKPGKTTSLGEVLPFGVEIKNGVAQLERPLSWTRPEAAMSFSGGIRLDGTLDLTGGVTLTPSTIKTLTLGKVTPPEPIPVGMKLTGKAWKPEVTGIDVKPAATTIAKLAASSLAGSLIGGERGKQVQAVIEGGEEKARAEAEAKRKELEAKAAEEKARLEAEAKRRAEEEAKKKLRGIFGR
ncbi:AsmA family protein [Pyxidicoccus sp. 3LG]